MKVFTKITQEGQVEHLTANDISELFKKDVMNQCSILNTRYGELCFWYDDEFQFKEELEPNIKALLLGGEYFKGDIILSGVRHTDGGDGISNTTLLESIINENYISFLKSCC